MVDAPAQASTDQSTVGLFNFLDETVRPSLFRNGEVLTNRDSEGNDFGTTGLMRNQKELTVDNARILHGDERKTLQANGFELLNAPLKDENLNFFDNNQVVRDYYAQCCDLVAKKPVVGPLPSTTTFDQRQVKSLRNEPLAVSRCKGRCTWFTATTHCLARRNGSAILPNLRRATTLTALYCRWVKHSSTRQMRTTPLKMDVSPSSTYGATSPRPPLSLIHWHFAMVRVLIRRISWFSKSITRTVWARTISPNTHRLITDTFIRK